MKGILFAAALLALAPAAHAGGLPLVERPASGAGDTVAIFYSGDGGWAALDEAVADGLVRAGVPVVGVDSLRYFAVRKAPEAAAADLSALITRYSQAWGKRRVIVAGYSFGADALPAILQRLPANQRAQVRLVAFVGLDKDGELKFQPGDWVGKKAPDAYAVAPVLAGLKGLPMICVYGAEETGPACPTFPASLIRQVRVGGGHHYSGAYDPIARAIVQAAGL